MYHQTEWKKSMPLLLYMSYLLAAIQNMHTERQKDNEASYEPIKFFV